MKVVINACYGGFGLTDDALNLYRERTGNPDIEYWEIDRSDSVLIDIIEQFGEDSYGDYAELKIIEIPDDVEWQIEDYDGHEWVAEKHRIWQ